jgi:hypothetical protein
MLVVESTPEIAPEYRIFVAPETATPTLQNVAGALEPAVQAPNDTVATGETWVGEVPDTVHPPVVRATDTRPYPVYATSFVD